MTAAANRVPVSSLPTRTAAKRSPVPGYMPPMRGRLTKNGAGSSAAGERSIPAVETPEARSVTMPVMTARRGPSAVSLSSSAVIHAVSADGDIAAVSG